MLHDQTLAVEETSKYLGMMLTNDLSWNKHVEKVAAKGNRTQLFIKRNQYTVIPKQSMQPAALPSPVQRSDVPQQCGTPNESNIQSLEQIQKRAVRFVMNEYTTRTPGCVTRMQEWMGHIAEETADSPCYTRLTIS